MKPRPRINVPLTRFDICFEVLGIALLVALWILTFRYYTVADDIVPIHYNAKGVADGFGPKEMLWYLPGLATLLYIFMTIINRFPHLFNFPVRINEENVEIQYKLAARMIRVTKVSLVIIMGLLVFASEINEIKEGAVIVLISGVLLIPIIIFMLLMIQNK